MPTGWLSWFVAGLLHPRLLVQPRPKSVDFHDAENRQRPCRMIMRHVKNPLWPFGLGPLGKIKFQFCIVRAQVPPSGEETGRQNYLRQLISPTWYRNKK
ncbi:hypothetical protein TNCV_3565581 [Trichonephila clavipes]|nr:hypothetical protein TNCV_3565581 [Trichonephila clavipes]